MGFTYENLSNVPIDAVKGIGGKKSSSFSLLGISSVLDLLTHYPKRYIDRSRRGPVSMESVDHEILLLGTMSDVTSRRTKSGKTVVQAELDTGTSRCQLLFFNQPWRTRQLRTTSEVAVFGKLQLYGRRFQMANPVVDIVGDRTGAIVPIYPMSEKAGVSTWDIHRALKHVLEEMADFIEDPLPSELLADLNLPSRDEAVRSIHLPGKIEEAREARNRLIFDELFRLQLALVMRKERYKRDSHALTHDTRPFTKEPGKSDSLAGSFLASLPFPLTSAQRKVIFEIAQDMSVPVPMHRLVQGDVGSGKTLVALFAMLFAVQSGHQAALLAPTEVLAEQHFLSISNYMSNFEVKDSDGYSLFENLDRRLRVELLVGSVGSKRKRIVQEIRNAAIDIVVGTHALLSQDVSFQSLGLVVVDEQHRFGVDQRAELRSRERQGNSCDPDTLVMTATPIPRTAAMTVYGDLDISVVDQLPPGRTPIKTKWIKGESESAYRHLVDEIRAGGQGYVVCPLVEGSEKIQSKSAVEEFERLSLEELNGLRLGLIHGQLKADEKERVMNRFRSGEIDVLVATTVIEVGVDVPNANVMIIEDADRFGIAQLHQLRGRVGRGKRESYCYLLSSKSTEIADLRLGALERSNDGFFLAEKDLELRKEGTILGTRQRGANDLRLASLIKDKDTVQLARVKAEGLVAVDPLLAGHEALRRELRLMFQDADFEYLFRS